MSNMEEKVARVICAEFGDDPDIKTTFQNTPCKGWEMYLDEARAAIEVVMQELNVQPVKGSDDGN